VAEQKRPDQDDAREPPGEERYRDVERLEVRLEAAQADLGEVGDVLRESQDLRDDVERAIAEVEKAIARAAPRFQ
jgi:hypothetical protein